jgi:hypothetical protein
MRYSKLAAMLVAACTLATSPMVFATAYFQHGYACKLVSSGTLKEIPATYSNGVFENTSGVSALAMCPMTCDVSDSLYTIYVGTNVTSCTMFATGSGGSTNLGAGTRTQGVGLNSFAWSTAACSEGGNALEIQCTIPNNQSVFFYISQ